MLVSPVLSWESLGVAEIHQAGLGLVALSLRPTQTDRFREPVILIFWQRICRKPPQSRKLTHKTLRKSVRVNKGTGLVTGGEWETQQYPSRRLENGRQT